MSTDTVNIQHLTHWHTKDSDCIVDPDTGRCMGCGVSHVSQCPFCGNRGFHRQGCDGNPPQAPAKNRSLWRLIVWAFAIYGIYCAVRGML